MGAGVKNMQINTAHYAFFIKRSFIVFFEPEVLFAILLLLPAGAVITWLIMRSMISKADQAGEAEIKKLNTVAAERDEAIRLFESRLLDYSTQKKQLKDDCSRLEKDLAVEQQKNSLMSEIRDDLSRSDKQSRDLEKELRKLTADLAREKERTANLMDVNQKLDLREKTIDDLKEQLSSQKSTESRLRTRMEQEGKQAEAKLVLLDEAKSELTNQFRILAQEILEEKGKTFSEQSRAGLKGLLDPFRDQLNEFRQKVDNVYVHEAGQRASLKKEIESLRDLNQQINQEAINLTRALKGDKKAMGTWGELILERVLEQSGLRKGVEYETQGGFRDTGGKLLKPDVIVHLPEEKDVVVDSKVSLVAYERYARAEEDSMQKKALSEHMASVRAHIEGLSRKDYSALKGLRSLDFVLMFMPVEAAFVAAFRGDMTLYSYAFERKIIVVTPSTLLATLKTIENIWRYERQNKNAQTIFHKASAIYDKLRLFVESMEKLGKQLDTAQITYDEAMNRLVRGKGNVISQASRFSELGVPVKRPLPRTMTEIAETEDIGKSREAIEEK